MKKLLILLGIFLLIFLFGSAFNQEWVIQAELDEDMDLAAGKVISINPLDLKPMTSEAYQTWNFRIDSAEALILSSGPADNFF